MIPIAAMTSSRRSLRWFVGVAALLAAAPVGARVPEQWTTVRHHYVRSIGVGGAVVPGMIRIASGSEDSVASRALLAALRAMSLSVTAPAVGLDGALPHRRTWRTDVASLPSELMENHNRGYPQFRLPVARYGLGYVGQFDTSSGRFRYRMSAVLFERGSLSSWRRVADSRYAGDFFVAHLVALLGRELEQGGLGD